MCKQLRSLIRVYTVCHSVCIVWTHCSMEEPHSSNFRVVTTNILGVRIFRKITVDKRNILQVKGFTKSNFDVWIFGKDNVINLRYFQLSRASRVLPHARWSSCAGYQLRLKTMLSI